MFAQHAEGAADAVTVCRDDHPLELQEEFCPEVRAKGVGLPFRDKDKVCHCRWTRGLQSQSQSQSRGRGAFCSALKTFSAAAKAAVTVVAVRVEASVAARAAVRAEG